MSEQTQEAEFDVVASWTVDSVGRLGADHAVPAACRGSGGPGAIDWLADWLVNDADARFIDVGAGLGGPAARLAERSGLGPVLSDPMVGAVTGCRRLFGLPAVVSVAQRLPFAEHSFEAAWALGVLSTTEDKAGVLAELRRILVPQGRLGLVVYVAATIPVPGEPESNTFPTRAELEALISEHGFEILASADVADLPDAEVSWEEAEERVEADLQARHGDDERWVEAQAGERRVSELLADGLVSGRAYRLAPVSGSRRQ